MSYSQVAGDAYALRPDPGIPLDDRLPVETLPPIRGVLLPAPDSILFAHESQIVQVENSKRRRESGGATTWRLGVSR